MTFALYRIRQGQHTRELVACYETAEAISERVGLLSCQHPCDLYIVCDGDFEVCRVRNGNVWSRDTPQRGA